MELLSPLSQQHDLYERPQTPITPSTLIYVRPLTFHRLLTLSESVDKRACTNNPFQNFFRAQLKNPKRSGAILSRKTIHSTPLMILDTPSVAGPYILHSDEAKT